MPSHRCTGPVDQLHRGTVRLSVDVEVLFELTDRARETDHQLTDDRNRPIVGTVVAGLIVVALLWAFE